MTFFANESLILRLGNWCETFMFEEVVIVHEQNILEESMSSEQATSRCAPTHAF